MKPLEIGRDDLFILIIGFSLQLIHWSEEVLNQLVDEGHYVIVFDNRDTGQSSKMEEAGPPVENGRDAAETLPDAELMIIKGMDHNPPQGGPWPQIVEAISAHTNKASS